MKRLLIMTAGLLGVLAVQATTYTWTGGGAAGSWRDPANWGGSGYPNGTDDVAIFDKDAAVTLDTGAVTPIAKFEIGANAMVTIADDGSSSFQITTRKGATSLGPRLAAGAKLYLSATMDWKTTETTSNRIDPQVLAGAELHLRGKLTTDAGNVYFQGYGDVYFDGDCDIDGTSVFHFGIFATSTDKKLRVFVLDRANIAVRSILTGANSQSPATEFVQEGEETAITLANGNFGLGYDTALTAGYRNGGNSYTIKSGSLTITGSATGGSGCFYVGGKQEGAFIQEGGTVTIRKIEVGSTMAADKVAVALKGGILKFTEGTSEPYSNVLAFANDCRMEVTGGTFAWPAEFHPSYLPQIGWGGRFTITTTKDKTNAMWDFGLSTIRPGATFVYAKGCTMRFYNHFTTFGLGLEVGTNATLTVEGFSTITLPAGTTDPWKVKICDGATLKLANYATRLALPLDLEIEGTGKISTPDVRNGLVAHRLTVGGVEKPFGRYLAKDSGFFTGSLNESSVIVPRVWTGKGDGKSWTDAANWSDETESAYVDLSRATTVELPDAPTTLAFVSVLGDATDGKVTLTGDKLLTFNDTSYAVAAFAAEGRELVLDADVRVSAGCLGLAGGGAVRFKRRYPGGDGGTAPFALDCDVYYDGTGELYPKTDSATQNFLTFWTFNMGYSRFFIDEGARLSGWRLICGPKGYVEFDEIHQRGGTVNLGSFYLNNHNFTTRKLTYYLEGGMLTVDAAINLNGSYSSNMTRYPGGSFEMSGGTLDCKGLNTTLNQNYFRLNGGTVILRGHASGSTSAADAGGSVITNECGYYLGGVTIKPISGNTTGSAGNVNFTGNTQVCLTGINGDTVIDRSGDIYTANFDSGVKLVGPGGLNTFGNHALTIAGHVEFTGRLTCGSYYLYLTPSSTLAGPEEIVVASDGHLILRGKIEKSPKRLCVDGELANDSGDFNTLTVEEFVYKGVDKPNGTYTSANLPALKRLTIVVQKPTEWLADGKGSLSGLPDGTVKTLTEPVTLTELTCGSVAGGTNTVTGAAVTFADGAVIDVQKGNTLVIGTDVVLAGKVTKTGFGKVVFNGKVSAPDGVDLSQAANDVFWLTVRHGSADFDGTVTGVRIASCSGDGDTPLVVLGEHCTVSNRAIVLTAYCEDGSVKNCRGETHQEGAVLDYTTLPAGIAATYSVVPMSRPFGGCGRYVLTSGEIRTLKAFSFVPKWDDQGSFDFVQDGGTITSEDGWSFARNSSGQMFTYTLNDGLVHLRAGFSSYNSNMARIVLNGGRIWSYGSAVYLLKRDNVTLEVNGAVTIEVPEGRTTACTTPFAGTGTVTFTGGGTLQLSGPYELATFTALQGATAFYAEAAAAMSADCAFTVEKGAKLDLAYDGEMTIGSLVYDGRERRGRVYHAGEASAVGRMLLGTGDLNVLTGDGPGLTILIR